MVFGVWKVMRMGKGEAFDERWGWLMLVLNACRREGEKQRCEVEVEDFQSGRGEAGRPASVGLGGQRRRLIPGLGLWTILNRRTKITREKIMSLVVRCRYSDILIAAL